jgi:hypothetical protein
VVGGRWTVAVSERLVEEAPPTASYRGALAFTLRHRTLALRDLAGDTAGAAADSRRALELLDGLPSPSGEDWFETGCCRAALAGLAAVAAWAISTGEATSQADAAMSLLRRAVSSGYRNVAAVCAESALRPLRSRADFKLVLMDLVFPAEPQSKGTSEDL